MKKYIFTILCLSIGWSVNMLYAQQFVNPLPIPALISPQDDAEESGNRDTIRLRIDAVEHIFNPNGDTFNTPIKTYAYNNADSTHLPNTVLAPTLRWRYKDSLHVEVQNNLDEPTTTHWHGAHVPNWADGGPHQRIAPNSVWAFDIEVKDKSATMWYHPHLMGKTYEHVQLGMSGMLYVDDPPAGDDDSILVELHELLPHDYGINDFPIIVQTKKFFKPCPDEDLQIFTEGFNSDYQYIINGIMNPSLKIPADLIRFRVLNGDAKYGFNYKIGHRVATATANSQKIGDFHYEVNDFHLIATDAGYTDKSYKLQNVVMGPGERTEWLVDFRNQTIGDSLYLLAINSEMSQGIIGSGLLDTVLMQLVVGAAKTSSTISLDDFPIDLHPQEIPEHFPYTKERIKNFTKNPLESAKFQSVKFSYDSLTMECKEITKNNQRHEGFYLINETPMDINVVNDTVLLDSTEIWTIENWTNVAHPFHIHDIHFHVINIELRHADTIRIDTFRIPIGNETDSTTRNRLVYVLDTANIFYTSIPLDSLPYITKGPKDNVLVSPNWRLSFVTKFTDFGVDSVSADKSYMYHCHILPHEDRGMMGQFVVWNGTNDDPVTSTIESILNIKQLKVYPNPASTTLNIDGTSTKESYLRIFDLQGRLLKTIKLPAFAERYTFDISELPEGLIFVEWLTDKYRAMSKIVISRYK